MNSGNMALDAAFDIVLTVLPIVLALMVFACLIRAIKMTKDCRPDCGGKYDGYAYDGDYCHTCGKDERGISGRYLYHICHDFVPGGDASDQGVHGRVCGKQKEGEGGETA